MKNFKYIWVLGIIGTLLIIVAPIVLLIPNNTTSKKDPWASVPVRPPHTDHSSLMTGTFETGQDVTKACLTCHETAASDLMHTSHWTWTSDPVLDETRNEMVSIGKANIFNNFCIGIQSNWTGCTRCHVGYGWEDANYDFTVEENVD